MLTRPLLCPEFVGRGAEIDELVSCARASARGRGGCVLIEGDAGIGKSRLLDELRSRLRGSRAAIVSGACYEFGAAPFGPIVEIFADLGAPDALLGFETQAEQFAAVAERFERVSAHRSTICLVEDVHWADEATLQLLTYLAGRIERYRLLLVLTVRSEELHRDPLVLAHTGKIARLAATTHIHLLPLEPAEIAHLIRVTLADRSPLAREIVERITERSEGNPFFAEELLKNAVEHRTAGDPDALPLTVRAMVVERLETFAPRQRRLLAVAAVIGRPFAQSFLQQIADETAEVVAPTLRLACEGQLLAELPGEPVTYRFRHALTREAVADEMPAAELRPLHRRIAEQMEATAPDHFADIGYHFWSAYESEPARVYNERAGNAAERSQAYPDAVRFYERALTMSADDLQRAPLFASIARCLAHTGEPDRATGFYEAATRLYRAAGRVTEASNLSYSLIAAAHFFGDGARALALTQSALAASSDDADTGEANGRTHIMLCGAYVHADLGHAAAARSMLEEASATVPADATVAVTSMLENTRMRCALVEGDADGVLAAAERYREVVARLGNDDYATRMHLNVGADCFAIGLDEPAGREFAAAIPQLQARRWTAYEGYARALEAQRLFRRGALRDARAVLERAIYLPIDMSLARANIATAVLLIGGALGDDASIDRLVDARVLDQTLQSGAVFMIGSLLSAYVRRLVDRGESVPARRLLAQVLAGEEHPLAFGAAFVDAARYGDRTLTERVRRAFAAAPAPLARTPAVRAHRALFEAVAARRFGDPAAAPAHAAEARSWFERLGWRYDVALAHEAAGETAQALAIFTEIGAVRDLRRLERLALPGAGSAPARGALSAREREIALLVADGATNKSIARRLVIVEKTVEKHISSIYGKLGFSKRTQLTAFVIREIERSG